MPNNIATASFKSTGSTTSRTLGARWADVINVKDYGATGDGSTNDQAAIQAAFDAAFGTSGSPHGTAGQYQNKAVFFPVGYYKVSTTVTLTDVSAGHIFGGGMNSTTLEYTGGSAGVAALTVNGMVNTRIENMSFVAGSSSIGLDLDWDGTGVGLNSNTFADILFNAGTGCRIANTGNDGASNLFINTPFSSCGTGLKVVGADATNQTICSGGASDPTVAGYHIQGGSIALFGTSHAGNSNVYDISVENGCRVAVYGTRSEGKNFIETNGPVVLGGIVHSGASNGNFISTTGAGAKIIADACRSITGVVIGSTGTLYLRGVTFDRATPLAGFSGTIAQNI